jgi:hypothetical protein
LITTNTVFVVGAGASVPFGMPTGGQLLDTAQKLDLHNTTIKLANQFSADRVEPLQAALVNCQDSSIDALLEQRPDIELAGRHLIASLLLESERNSAAGYRGIGSDWFRYVWDEMVVGARGADAFGANHVSFITYNYDRMLEYKMIGGLKARYRAGENEIRQVLDAIPIIHLHGSLGPLPEISNGGGVPFGLDTERRPDLAGALQQYLAQSADSIRIVHQANPNDEFFTRARELLSDARQVFFLGFGFGATNVQRLQVMRIPRGASVMCSAYQLTEAEQAELISEPFLTASRVLDHDLRIGRAEWDCRRLLRENLGVLRRR